MVFTSGDVLTFANAHGLNAGEAIRVVQSDGVAISGTGASGSKLTPGHIYYVLATASTTTLTLADADGNAVAFDGDSGTNKLTFEKVNKSLK